MDNELKILLTIAFVIVIYLMWTSRPKQEIVLENFTSEPLPWDNNQNDMNRMYMLDDGADGNLGLQNNMCSQSCCSPQYPTPFPMPFDPLVCGSEEEYMPSNFTCTNADQNAGCMCLTKDQADFLGSRGGNA